MLVERRAGRSHLCSLSLSHCTQTQRQLGEWSTRTGVAVAIAQEGKLAAGAVECCCIFVVVTSYSSEIFGAKDGTKVSPFIVK